MQPCQVALKRDRIHRTCGKPCVSNHGLTANRAVKGVVCADHAGLCYFCGPQPASRPSTRSRSRPGPEAAISLVKPACSLTFNPFGTINSAHGHIPVVQSPPKTTGKSPPFPAHTLDSSSGSASTTGSRGPSWLCSIEERKASQSLPAPNSGP